MNSITKADVSKIKEKIVQAASDGLSKSALMRSQYSVDIQTGALITSPSLQHISASSSSTSASALSSATVMLTTQKTSTPQKQQLQHSSIQNNSHKNIWNFNTVDLIQTNSYSDKKQYEKHSIIIQEQMIVHEVIYCLSGMRGKFVQPIDDTTINESGLSKLNLSSTSSTNDVDPLLILDEYKPIKFKISDYIQIPFRDIILEILPAASHYAIIKKFTQKSSMMNNDRIFQALSAALRTLLDDYLLFLVHLETEHYRNSISLHTILYVMRPRISILETITELIQDINRLNLRGGSILTLLYKKLQILIGNENSTITVEYLLQLAAKPYFEMLQLWLLKGIIYDPNEEFFIEDNEIFRQDEVETDYYSADYWEKRYTIRRERIPIFLETLSDIILRTGKYLNVIAQCGSQQQPQPQTKQQSVQHQQSQYTHSSEYIPVNDLLNQLEFTTHSDNHIEYIQNAFQIASKRLLKVLMQENDLMGHLLSVKRYLLLQQGDFIAQFMDASEDELMKNVDKILPMKLDNLLGLTLRLSSAKCDPYKDDLHCQLFPFELVKQMSKIHLAGSTEEEYWQNEKIDLSGFECFAFRYEVQWPISLVLNHFAILEYQMLFRQLFYCKHVERQLCKIWKDNNNAKKFAPDTAELYRSAFTLRQRMMNAIQNLEYYMMIEVIEPAWHDFIEKLNFVVNIDDVFVVHQEFLDVCLQNCMLKNPDLLRLVTKLCNVCLSFCKFIQKSQQYFIDAELTSMLRNVIVDDSSDSETEVSSLKQSESSMAPSDTFSERIKRFDLEFTFLLIGLCKQINNLVFENPTGKFINLIHRINFNSFYNDQLIVNSGDGGHDTKK